MGHRRIDKLAKRQNQCLSDVDTLIQSGSTIDAIKRLREDFDLGLSEALAAVRTDWAKFMEEHYVG